MHPNATGTGTTGDHLHDRAKVRPARGTGRSPHYSDNGTMLCGRGPAQEITVEEAQALGDYCAQCTTAAEARAYALSLAKTSPTAAAAVALAETLERANAGHDATPTPAVHHFGSTQAAYDASQCRDDIRDGDVLVIESEHVVGFLVAAWPVAITVERGALAALTTPAHTYADGSYATSAHAAAVAALELGFLVSKIHSASTILPQATQIRRPAVER